MKLKRYKKWIAAMLTITLVMMVFCITIDVHADDITVTNTFGDITYGYTNDDFLTNVNYNSYYDDVDNGLKYSVNSDVYINNYDSDYGTNMINTVFGNMTNLNNTEFPDVPGKHIGLYVWWRSTYSVYFYTLVVDGNDDLAFVNGYLCSKSSFTIKHYVYSCGSGTFNGTYTRYTGDGFGYNIIDDTDNIQYDVTNGIYYRNFGGMCVYSEIPYLFTYKNNSSYTDANYLGQSPYSYQNWYNVYNAYVNNTDDTGFVIDRRTEHMIEETSDGGSGVDPSQYGFKQGSFGNILYGGNLDNQKLMVAYELNDTSSTIANDLYLKLNYRYIFNGLVVSQDIIFDEDYYNNTGVYDMYSLNNNNYVNVDLSKVFDSLWENDGDYASNLGIALTDWGGVATGRSYPIKVMDKSASFLFKKLSDENLLVTNPVSVEWDNSFFDSISLTYKDVTVSLKLSLTSIINGTSSGSYINRLDDVELIVTESIYNASTGEESSPYTFIYNYLTNTYSELGTLETSGESFDGSYNYGGQSLSSYTSDDIGFDIAKGTYYPSSNSSAYGGQGYGGNASIGNITIGAGETIIDMPADEWLQHSPNFNSLITTLKTGITSVSEDSESVLVMLKDTYTIFPVEVWGYLALAICTINSLAVIRYIRRG